MEKSRLEALINLLDDPDDTVALTVTENLLKAGRDVIPVLEQAWEEAAGSEIFQERLENVINDIQFQDIKRDLAYWCHHEKGNLIKGAFIIAKYQYPEIKFRQIDELIEKLVRDVWLEINNDLTALEKVRIMNDIFFGHHGFQVNKTNLFSPYNSYINYVLDAKKGNALSLSIIYMTIAQRLGMSIEGVNLPNNFIMAYMDRYVYGDLFRDNVLFYMDPLSNGAALSRKEIDHYLKKINVKPHESFYTPCDHIKILQRLLSNLIVAYNKTGQESKVEQIKILFSILSTEGMED
ncbi:MAG: transglutaminase family protein [bacterium]